MKEPEHVMGQITATNTIAFADDELAAEETRNKVTTCHCRMPRNDHHLILSTMGPL